MARFIQRGKSKYTYLPAVTTPATGPTVAEVTAGTELSDWIADISGFTFNSTTVEANDMGHKQTIKIAGVDETADSTLTVYDDDTSVTHETLLAKGTLGWIAYFKNGVKTAGSKVNLYPIEVIGNNPTHTVAVQAATSQVGVAINGQAYLNKAVQA